MLACPHERLQNHTFIDEGVFVKINSCGLNLRILRVAASSNPALNRTRRQRSLLHLAPVSVARRLALR